MIRVRGLFGRLDYDLAVDSQVPTVLTGANGTGKSTILRLVHAVASGDIPAVLSAPIRELILSFAGEADLVLRPIVRAGVVDVRWGEKSTRVEAVDLSDMPAWVERALRDFDFASDDLSRHLLEYARIEGQTMAMAHDVIRRVTQRTEASHRDAPQWLTDFQERFQVLYVTDQRLIIGDATDPRRIRQERDRQRLVGGGPAKRRSQLLAVEAASEDIGHRVSKAGLAYARESQNIDRNFPNEVIRSMRTSNNVSIEDVNALNEQVTQQREHLKQIGLLIQAPGYQPPMETGDSLSSREVRAAVAAVLQSDLKKLRVLNQQSAELSAFKKFLERRLNPKSVEFGMDGIHVGLPNGKKVGVSELSSGEQHLLVLAYEILFKAAVGTLVIIDEPELSLHVQWQASLLSDLISMGEGAQVQYLMATHSPTLVASMPNSERSLDELTR